MEPIPDPAPPVAGRRRPAGFRARRGAAPSPPAQTPRHLHRSGPHSLAVSLPKSWIEGHALSRGSLVWLHPRDDGRLEIAPSAPPAAGGPADRVLSVEAAHFGEPEVLARTVFGGYVVGYDRIDLFDAEGFDPDRRRELERTAHALVGLQVVFLDTHRARLQSFLDARRHPVPKVLARAGLVVEEMAERLTEAVRGSSPVPIAELGAMEVESDRLYALTLRQLMLAQGDPALARRLEVREPRDLLGGRVVGKVYEEIADLLCRAASELEAGLRGPAWPGRLREDLERHAEALRTTLHDAALALQQSDRTVAHRVLRDREEGLRALLRTEQALARARLPHRQTASLAVFAWGVGTSRRLCGTIAEVALNQSIQSTATGSAPPAAASASAPQRA